MSEIYGTLSEDAHNGKSDVVAFRKINTITPLSVTQTAQVIPASDWRNSVIVENRGASAVYYGDSTVTSTNGITIPVNGTAEFQCGPDVDIYVVCAAGLTATLNGLEVG